MNKKYTGGFFHVMMLMVVFCWIFLVKTASQESTGDYKLRTVVIDAGHGGKDPGSIGKKTNEKDVTLAIALKLGDYIEKLLPDVKVIYTRKTDVFVPLYERAEIANSNKADLFISIHANGNTNTSAYGTETLLLGYHRVGENFEVAKQENSVILMEDDYSTKYEGFDPNSPESYIMFSLMQERYLERSVSFAALIQDQFRDRARRKDRGVHRQGLLVLARTAMPGVLVETGFITNPQEEDYLMSSQGQDLIASAIFRAFRDYKNIVESKSSFTATSISSNLSVGKDTKLLADKEKGSQTTPEPVQIETDTVRESPVEFKIQVAASTRSIPLDSPLFSGIDGIAEYHVGEYYKYAVGSSTTLEEIMNMSSKIKERFPDAFIIGVKDGQIIPLNQALKESQQNK